MCTAAALISSTNFAAGFFLTVLRSAISFVCTCRITSDGEGGRKLEADEGLADRYVDEVDAAVTQAAQDSQAQLERLQAQINRWFA